MALDGFGLAWQAAVVRGHSELSTLKRQVLKARRCTLQLEEDHTRMAVEMDNHPLKDQLPSPEESGKDRGTCGAGGDCLREKKGMEGPGEDRHSWCGIRWLERNRFGA